MRDLDILFFKLSMIYVTIIKSKLMVLVMQVVLGVSLVMYENSINLLIKNTKYFVPLDLVFSDVWRLAPVISMEGARFYVNFVEIANNYNWLYILSRKSKVYNCFIKLKALVEN